MWHCCYTYSKEKYNVRPVDKLPLVTSETQRNFLELRYNLFKNKNIEIFIERTIPSSGTRDLIRMQVRDKPW